MAETKRTVSIIIQARNEASKALNSVIGSLSSFAGLAAVVAVGAGAMALGFKKVTDAASEQEQADIALAQALSTIGQNTAETRADLAAFIDQMEDMSKVNDEAISTVVSLLAQFGRLSGTELKRATRAVLDYSAATGVDAVTAATQLSNIIVKGTGRLQGINTQFDQGASSADRYAKAMSQLERLQGAAESKGKTFEGTLSQIGIEFERLEEAIGKNIVESDAFRGVVQVIADLIKTGTGIVKEHGAAFRQLIVLWAQGAIFVTKLAVQYASWEAEILAANIRTAEFVVLLGTLVTALGAVASKKLGIDAQAMGRAAGAAAGMIADLERARSVVTGLGAAGEEALKALDEALKNVGKGVVDVAGEIPVLSGGLKTVQSSSEALDEVLKRLGGPTMEELNRQTRDFWQLVDLVAQAQAEAADPSVYDPIIEKINEMAEQLHLPIENLEAMSQAASEVTSWMRKIEAAAGEAATQGAAQLGDAFVDAAFGAQVSWQKAIQQILKDIAKAIVRALILKAIQSSFGVPGPGLGGGANLLGGFGGFAQHGGEVRGGIMGMDSVAAMLTPGEIVLPASLAEDFASVADMGRDGRTGRQSTTDGMRAGGRPVNLSLAVFGGDRFVGDLVDHINRYVERRGGRLISSEVLA